MENKKIIKKVIVLVIVLALLLVGYFFITTQEDDVSPSIQKDDISLNIKNSLGMAENSILGEVLKIDEKSITILGSSSGEGFSSNEQLNEIEILINAETRLVKIPLSVWYGENTEQNNLKNSIGLENLEIRSLIIPFVNGEQMTDSSLVATTIVLIDFEEE